MENSVPIISLVFCRVGKAATTNDFFFLLHHLTQGQPAKIMEKPPLYEVDTSISYSYQGLIFL